MRSDRPGREAVQEQLQRILASSPFLRAERMKRFLQYSVEQVLAGEASSLKEYAIALDVYDKGSSFDPRLDPIVRVEAGRLRAKLREYYETEGRADRVLISLPKRSYRPTFRFADISRLKVSPRTSSNSEARRLYLKGRYYWNKRAPKALFKALECLNESLSKQPNFALALAGVGDCYASLAWLESFAPSDSWPQALDAAQAALRIEPALSQARTTVACAKALYERDWAESESEFREAIATNGRYATAHHWYAMFCLAPQRRLEEALSELKRARDLDPSSAIISCHLGQLLYFGRRYQDAILELEKSIKLDPTLHLAYLHLGFAYAGSSAIDPAKAALAKARRLSSDPLPIAALAYIHALAGEHSMVRKLKRDLTQLASPGYLSPGNFALIESATGNTDVAFEYLRQAVIQRAPRIIHLKVDPAFDSIKTDGRFLSLLEQLNLSD